MSPSNDDAAAGAGNDLTSLAGAALRRSAAGWALVRNGALAVTNPAYRRLGAGTGTRLPWRPCDGQRTHSSLDELVVAEASLVRPEVARAARRFTRGEQTIEVLVERITLGTDEPAVLAMVCDVTDHVHREEELQLSQQQLIQQERMRAAGELALGIAHDLNNIVAALSLRLQVLSIALPASKTAHDQNVDTMRRIVGEAAALIGKLEAVGHKSEVAIGPVDLEAEIRAAMEIAESGLRLDGGHRDGPRVQIVERLPPNLPQVRGIGVELRRVFVNLLLNARDAMPEGGTIAIRGEVLKETVKIFVEDEGSGIGREALPRIFDAFFTTKGHRETGLGLAMAKNLMARIDGEILARNGHPGGAQFELRFRRLPAGRARRALTTTARITSGGARPPKRSRSRAG